MNDMSGKYLVGYGKPPAEHRFRKGQSGNPLGRPRGARNKVRPFDPVSQPTDNLILEEAYRPVTIREGDRVIELPAIQAAVRSLAISAMKGSRFSQKALAEIVREVEQRRHAEHLAALESMIEYKQKWSAELKRRRALGIDEPDPVPHPDDVILDMRKGTVHIEGPLDERDKLHWDERIARRAEAQAEVNYCAEHHRKARSPRNKAMWLEEWHWEQRLFDIINDAMPGRYKVQLDNRSHAQGASREGEALAEVIRNKKAQGTIRGLAESRALISRRFLASTFAFQAPSS